MTNRCWIVCKQINLSLSYAAEVHFLKQGENPKKRCKTYSKEEINTVISEKVEAALKASKNDPKKTDEGDTESVNMEKFNYDPASELESE